MMVILKVLLQRHSAALKQEYRILQYQYFSECSTLWTFPINLLDTVDLRPSSLILFSIHTEQGPETYITISFIQ